MVAVIPAEGMVRDHCGTCRRSWYFYQERKMQSLRG